MMQDLKEPTQETIEDAAKTPGTHYFVVEPWKLSAVRTALYAKVADTSHNCHTSYNGVRRTLRVVISD